MTWAVAHGYRSDNPAGEAGALALPKRDAVPHHHRALPQAEVGAAIARLREASASLAATRCFEFPVRSACRSGEVRRAGGGEIDLDAREWTLPGTRMQAPREHRVPWLERPVAVLRTAQALRGGSGLLLSSTRPGKPLSDATLHAAPRAGPCRRTARVPVELAGQVRRVFHCPA